MTAATRSVNLELQPSKIQAWRASCQDPIPPELHDKVKFTLSCGGHLQIHGDIEPSPIVLGEQTSMEKTKLPHSPVDRAVLLSQSTSHTGAHLMKPTSEAYEAEDRCFRVAVAKRLMHPAASNAADVAQSCSNKSAAGQILFACQHSREIGCMPTRHDATTMPTTVSSGIQNQFSHAHVPGKPAPYPSGSLCSPTGLV